MKTLDPWSALFLVRVRLADWLKSFPHKSFLFRYSEGPFQLLHWPPFRSTCVEMPVTSTHAAATVFLGTVQSSLLLSEWDHVPAAVLPLVCCCAATIQASRSWLRCHAYSYNNTGLAAHNIRWSTWINTFKFLWSSFSWGEAWTRYGIAVIWKLWSNAVPLINK